MGEKGLDYYNNRMLPHILLNVINECIIYAVGHPTFFVPLPLQKCSDK